MTAKEKAYELFDEYSYELSNHIFNGSFDISKQCALIAVEYIINSNPHSNPFNTDVFFSTMLYWQEVKEQLLKL
jgi:hypothetical protein